MNAGFLIVVAVAGVILALAAPNLLGIGVGLALGAGIGAAVLIGRQRRAQPEDPEEGLPMEVRSRLAPIRKSMSDLETLATERKGDLAVSVIAKEALDEARRLHFAAAAQLRHRTEILRHASSAESMAAKVSRLAAAGEESALASAKMEETHNREQLAIADKIEQDIRRAETALAETVSRLRLSTARDTGSQDVRERLSQLQTLSKSLEEAEQMLGAGDTQ